MGMLVTHLNLLARENKSFPISGDVLTLGQQAVYAKLESVKNIFNKNGIKCKDIPDGFDTKNKIPDWFGTPNDKNTNVQTVLKLLGADNVFTCDASDYETPDFIIDLNYPVDIKLKTKFNCILDIGTLEHVFDVATALSNVNYMLKKGGKLILILPATNAIDHGFYMFSPTVLFDFFSKNGYDNFSCYLRQGRYLFDCSRKANLYRYLKPGDTATPFFSKFGVEVAFFAIKNTDKDDCVKPFQSIYKHLYEKEKNANNIGNLGTTPKFKNIKVFFKRILPIWLVEYYVMLKLRSKNIKYIGKY